MATLQCITCTLLSPLPCCLPRRRCSLQPNLLELGPLKFGEPTSGHLTLTNTGSVEATYLFVPLPRAQKAADGQVAWDDDQPLCPPWVQLSPLEGVLAPGGLSLAAGSAAAGVVCSVVLCR